MESLRSFLLGYNSLSCNKSRAVGYNLLSGFQEFVQKRYRIESMHHFTNIIDFYSLSNENALEIFFQLFNEYISKPIPSLSKTIDFSKLKTYSTCLEILQDVQKRPALFLGSKTVAGLSSFIKGGLWCEHKLGLGKENPVKRMLAFDAFVKEHYKFFYDSSAEKIIMFLFDDESVGFDEYLQLFIMFCK